MNRERLERLAGFLEGLPPEKLDMGRWAGGACLDPRSREQGGCGTTACALGWATTIPEFQAAGLKLRERDWGPGFTPCVETPDYDATGFEAGMVFFDLSYTQALHLFEPSEYPNYEDVSVGQVVERIREMLAEVEA